MSSTFRYQLPVEQTNWHVNGQTTTSFSWEYEDGRDSLLKLYAKGKKLQWDAANRIDWSQDLDPENPMQMPDTMIRIFGSPMWDKMTEAERRRLRHHNQAWQISQFLHGEQGALICTAKIVEQVPSMDAKFYAATQVMDEARHVEAYARLLHEKFELAYPITPPLQALLNNIIEDSRWDFTYLGMQVLIEGLALAAFQAIRDMSQNPLAGAVNAYVMQHEARHVAFGRFALRDYYPHLTEAERSEREEFVIAASYHMRDRFSAAEMWDVLGLPVQECLTWLEHSEAQRQFRTRLFSRIVPIIHDIGLWGAKVRRAYEQMGLLAFAEVNTDALLDADQKVAEEFDARRHVDTVVGLQ